MHVGIEILIVTNNRIQSKRLCNIQDALLSCCSAFLSTHSSGYSMAEVLSAHLVSTTYLAQERAVEDRGECLC